MGRTASVGTMKQITMPGSQARGLRNQDGGGRRHSHMHNTHTHSHADIIYQFM